MANKNIQIKFDIDNQDLEIASKSVMSVVQQIRFLKKELASGNYSQEQFEIMSKKLGDLEDGFAKTKARSGDFLTSLQLIPGPIGEIASKLNGAIGLLKTFSGFKLSDLKFQLRETADDIRGIFSAIGSWGEGTKEVKEEQDDLNKVVAEGTNINASAGQSILQNVKANNEAINSVKGKIQAETDYRFALESTIKGLKANIEEGKLNAEEVAKAQQGIQNYTNELAESDKYLLRYNEQLKTLQGTQKQGAVAAQTDAAAQGELSVASQAATTSTETQTAATKGLTVASNTTTSALTILKGVMASLGIGAIILIVTTLLTKLYELATSTKEADAANKSLNETLKEQQRILENDLKVIDTATKLALLRAKIAGQTEKEIFDIQKKGGEERLQLLRDSDNALFEEQRKLGKLEGDYAKLTNEQRAEKAKEFGERSLKLNQDIIAQILSNEEAALSEQLRIVEKGRNKNNKANEQIAKEKLEAKKAELDALIQLEIEKENTNKKTLEKLLDDRLKLELEGQKKSDAEKELARKENTNKVKAALDEDLQLRIKSINATIDEEQNSEVVSVERLKALLLEKKNLEIQNTQLTVEERKALVTKYEKDIRDIETKQREDKLVADLAANQGNLNAQIELYRQYAQEALNSEKYTEQQRIQIIQDANDKIRQLQQEKFQGALSAAQLEYGELYAYDSAYYDEVASLYDQEEQNYKDLLNSKQISQEEFDAFMVESNSARIALDKAELDAKMANFEAVSALFSASASLVGEQTKAGKALSIASATIDTYVSANKVLADPTPMPSFLRFALAAGAIVRGLSSVKKIIETKLPTPGGDTGGDTTQATKPMGTINVNAQKKAQGGMVSGPGTETSD